MSANRRSTDAPVSPFAWALLAAVTVVIRLPLLIQPQAIDDEVNYSVVAHRLLGGGTLYTDAVERRPPLTFWVYEGVFRLFGADNWLALHAVGVAWVMLTMGVLCVLGTRLFNRRVGFAAALIYSVLQPWWYFGNQAFNGEILMNLPIVAAYALMMPGAIGRAPLSASVVRTFGAGALVAVALLLKQPAGIAILPLFLFISTSKRDDSSWRTRLADTLALLAGLGAVLAVMGIWLVDRGIFRDAFYWSVLDHDVPHVFWRSAIEHTALFVLATLPAIAAAWSGLHRDAAWSTRPTERNTLLGLLAVSAIGAAASGRFFPHYYIGLLPALAVLAAPVVSERSARLASHRVAPRVFAAWSVAVVTATFAWQLSIASRAPRDTEAGRFIRTHAAASDRVFVWGRTPRIYLDGERLPAARYIDTFALTGRIFGPHLDVDTRSRIVSGAWEHLRDDFHAHAPAYLVDTESGPAAEYPISQFPWLAQVVSREYEPVARVAEGVVYRRRAVLNTAAPRRAGSPALDFSRSTQ